MPRTFKGGVVLGVLATAVVALAIAVLVLATDDGEDSSPATAKEVTTSQSCDLEYAGGPAVIEVSGEVPTCDEAEQVLSDLEAGGYRINEATTVGDWTCTQHPMADYPLLVECEGPGAFVLNGTAEQAHTGLPPTTQSAAPPAMPSGTVHIEEPTADDYRQPISSWRSFDGQTKGALAALFLINNPSDCSAVNRFEDAPIGVQQFVDRAATKPQVQDDPISAAMLDYCVTFDE